MPSMVGSLSESGNCIVSRVTKKRVVMAADNEADQGASGDNLCKLCQKRVYEMEKMLADKNIYHKMCFKCTHCKRILSIGNFASIEGNLYCKPHFLEIFKTKGNYEEGFGMERHSKQWQTTQQTTVLENSDGPAQVVKATSHGQNDENVENMPPIGNIKNRFESSDDAPAPRIQSTSQSQSYSERQSTNQDVEVFREEQGEKDVVHFQQLNSVRSMFESRGQGPAAPSSAPVKRASKWDKPKGPPPPPINRNKEGGDEGEGEEQMEASAASLAQRFQRQEEEDEYERKPVRKMTPPREDIERDVTEYQRRYSEERLIERDPDIVVSGDKSREEEELPPRAVTSSLLAKFKSFEDVNAPPPLPTSPKKGAGGVSASRGRQIVTTTTTTTTTAAPSAEKSSQLTPDSGISLSDGPHEGYASETVAQQQQHQQYHQQDEEEQYDGDVVRESDRNDAEELPDKGFTKSLLSKWKQIEQNAPAAAPQAARGPAPKRSWAYKEQRTTTTTTTSSAAVRSNGTTNATEAREEEEVDHREVVRESDNNEEEFLPPPSYTKNMLAKFKNMEQENDHGATQQAAAPRKFKWEVKEAKPILRHLGTRDVPPNAVTSNQSQSQEHLENNGYDYDNHQQHEQQQRYDVMNGDDVYEEVQETSYHQENHHAPRGDVYSEQQGIIEEELPPTAVTRNLLAKFKSMEDVNAPPPIPETANKVQKEAVTSIAVRKTSYRTSLSSEAPITNAAYSENANHANHANHEQYNNYNDMYNNDTQYDEREQLQQQQTADDEYFNNSGRGYEAGEPEQHVQYVQQVEGGEYENDPSYNSDVVRETDQAGEEELPERGTTRSLLAKWQTIETH